jgi:hypothetical protein
MSELPDAIGGPPGTKDLPIDPSYSRSPEEDYRISHPLGAATLAAQGSPAPSSAFNPAMMAALAARFGGPR